MKKGNISFRLELVRIYGFNDYFYYEKSRYKTVDIE